MRPRLVVLLSLAPLLPACAAPRASAPANVAITPTSATPASPRALMTRPLHYEGFYHEVDSLARAEVPLDAAR